MKRNVGRGIFAVLSLFISISGLMFMLSPTAASAKLLLDPQGLEGLSNLRAFLGASVLSIGISLMIAAVTARLDNARPAALFVMGLVFARVLSFAVDGPTPNFALYVAVPSTVFALLLVAHKLIVTAETPASAPLAA